MDASATTYIGIIIDVLVAAVITFVLLFLARRARREQIFVGFKERSLDEKYAGYSMLAIGVAVIVVSVYGLAVLLEGGGSTSVPFRLPNITISGLAISGRLLSFGFGISFWLMLFGLGGRKLVSLGLDMLRGRKAKLTRTLQETR